MSQSLKFSQLITMLANRQNIDELQEKYGFEIFETVVRLVKYTQHYKFYNCDIQTSKISKPINFLTMTVKDNTPVYDMLLTDDNNIFTLYQIKRQDSININNLRSLQLLAQQLNCEYKIILQDEYEKYRNLFDKICWQQYLPTTEQIILKEYQQDYYDKMCEMIEKYDKSCIFLPPRFGKTYLIGKYIQEHNDKKCCIFTSYPTECGPVYEKIQSDYCFNFSYQSRQYFQEANYKEKLEQYKDIDVIFLDEYHYGGKTELSQTVLKYLQTIANKMIKFIYISGTADSLIKIFKLPHINISKQVFEQINYPHLKINFIDNPKLKNLWQNKRITQKRLLLQEIQQYTNVTDENTFIYLETDGNSKEQQDVIGLPYVFCDSHKVGGTYPQLRNIFVFNQNLSELLIQQIFRCMNSTNIDEDRNIYIYDIQQIIEIIQYFQRLFNSQQSLKEYKSILPNCISIIGADQQIIDYINHQDFKLSCVTSANEKYIINKIDEKFNSLLSLKISKENKKIQEVQRAVQNLVNDLREVAKTEKVSPFILLIDRVCSYITLCCYTKDKQQCFNMNFNDYSLLQMYKLLNVNEINKLKEIVNSMYKINIVDDDFEFKIKWLCKVFDSQNNSQLIYNYYNKLQLYIATENKIIVYEKFMQQICTSTMYERKHNAEILTPISVCQEMIEIGTKYCECLQRKLNTLPGIIEPCCGKGAFCVCLYEKLRQLGYTEKEILEEILYINDINTFNTFIVQLILNPMQQHKMNVWNEDAVNGIDYSDFDLVITNPPYTRMKQNGYNQDGAQKIFDKIIIQAFAAKHQIMLIPKMWTFQLSLKEFKYQYLQHIIEIVEKGPSQQIFNNNCGNIQIIISEHEKHSVEIKETTSILDQYKYIDGRHFIAEKVQADKNIYQVEEFENSLPCFVSTKINKNCITYVDKEVCKNLQDLKYYYVVFYVKYGQPYTEYTKFKICKPGEIFNSSYGALQCDTEEQAKKLLNYLLIDAQQFIKQRQTSSMNKSVLQMIPQIEK